MSIYSKLAKIQKELYVPKGNYNGYGGFSYRSLDDIIKAVKTLCDDYQCVVYMTNEMEPVSERIYVKATVRLIDIETGEILESIAHAREIEEKKGMDGCQITGSASSYARKCALEGLFCIDNETDEEGVELEKAKKRILKYLKDNNKDFAKVFENQKLTSPDQLTLGISARYINHILKEGGTI